MKNPKYITTVASLLLATTLGSGIVQAEPAPKRIGIANFGEDQQLARSIAGFKQALANDGFIEGQNIVYTESHTNFDPSLVPQMVAKIQSDKPDLVFTITTPVSQIAKQALARSAIPVVFGVVTDPVAAGLTSSWSMGEKGITGASDLQDLEAVLKFAKALLPNARSVGVPYNPGEANDVALVEKVKEVGPRVGLTVATVGVDSANDIQQRIASLKGKADFIYNPNSNLLQPGVGAVAAGARSAGIPIINSTPGPVSQGQVLASFAVDYEQVGFNAGRLAVQILNGADPASLPISVPSTGDHKPLISKRLLAASNLALPAALADCDCLID